jgi:hypothetical protein
MSDNYYEKRLSELEALHPHASPQLLRASARAFANVAQYGRPNVIDFGRERALRQPLLVDAVELHMLPVLPAGHRLTPWEGCERYGETFDDETHHW